MWSHGEEPPRTEGTFVTLPIDPPGPPSPSSLQGLPVLGSKPAPTLQPQPQLQVQAQAQQMLAPLADDERDEKRKKKSR